MRRRRKEMSQEATEPPLSTFERTLSVQILGRIVEPGPPPGLGVFPDPGPKAELTFNKALGLIRLQRISRRLRDLVRGLLMSKAGVFLLADAVRYRIYITVRESHSRCREGYTEALRDWLLGLAERCTDVAGSSAACAELLAKATMSVGAPRLRAWIIAAVASGAQDHEHVREQLRRRASNIDGVLSLRYYECLNRVSGYCAQDTVRTIINGLAPWAADAAPGGGAQRVVLWAAVAGADIPPPLRRLCSGWMGEARADDWALQEVGSTSLQWRIDALCRTTKCACSDCTHG